MNKKLLIISIFLLCFYSNSQHLYGGSGITLTTIDYKNSDRESKSDLQPVNTFYYHAGMRDKANGNRTAFYRLGVTYTGYAAKTEISELNPAYNAFDLSFLGLEVGIDRMIFKVKDNFALFVSGFVSSELLLEGSETKFLGAIDLSENDDFNKINFFAKGGLTAQLRISKKVAIIAEGKYGVSFLNDYNQTEILTMKPLQVGLGLFVNLSSCNCNSF